MGTTTDTQSAARWLYAEGAPRFESEAFGEYHATYRADWSYSAAYREFHSDPRGSQLYRQYGRRPVVCTAVAR